MLCKICKVQIQPRKHAAVVRKDWLPFESARVVHAQNLGGGMIGIVSSGVMASYTLRVGVDGTSVIMVMCSHY